MEVALGYGLGVGGEGQAQGRAPLRKPRRRQTGGGSGNKLGQQGVVFAQGLVGNDERDFIVAGCGGQRNKPASV